MILGNRQFERLRKSRPSRHAIPGGFGASRPQHPSHHPVRLSTQAKFEVLARLARLSAIRQRLRQAETGQFAGGMPGDKFTLAGNQIAHRSARSHDQFLDDNMLGKPEAKQHALRHIVRL